MVTSNPLSHMTFVIKEVSKNFTQQMTGIRDIK